MPQHQKTFTAAQIAAALGINRQAVQGHHLRDVQPAGVQIVAGNEAAAWTVEQFPLQLRERLAAVAAQRGCRVSLNPERAGGESLQTFTAATIATGAGLQSETVREQMINTMPAAVHSVAGKQYPAWSMDQLPAHLCRALEAERVRAIETLLTKSREPWQPPFPLDKVCDADFMAATKLRDVLAPWLTQKHNPGISAAELEKRGVEDYRRAFGNKISTRTWRGLLARTRERDAGAENWVRLEIYLRKNPRQKAEPAAVVSAALADDFTGLDAYIATIADPRSPTRDECAGVWKLALKKFSSLVRAGDLEKTAARKVRQFLIARAPFLAVSRGALWIAFKRKLEALQAAGGNLAALDDGRAENGDRVEVLQKDIQLLEDAAGIKNSARIAAAWRREYSNLSDSTRARYRDPNNCPDKIYQLVSREKVDTMHERHRNGKRAVLKKIGGIHGNGWAGIPSMHSWAMDDVTSNIEVAFQDDDGSTRLILPQIIAVMDSSSRKIVGWSISDDKAPTAGLVCEAALNAFRKNNIPKELWVENGYVFGKSLLVNGKEDDQGRVVVSGLGQYGCSIHHFRKMSPTSKAELERSFEAIQRLMEEHPGYTGRHQMIDAPDEFKREQRLINSGKVEAKAFRYTMAEFKAVMERLFNEYNSTPNFGEHLQGLSPDEAFTHLADPTDPPIAYNPQLEWLFANEKEKVIVKAGGVLFKHRSTGRSIRVRGGRLSEPGMLGMELWAWVDREDPSMVTFMNLDYTDPFTVEVCKTPSRREHSLAPGSGVYASETAKIQQHLKSVEQDYKATIERVGNPRHDLLKKIREQSAPADPTESSAGRRIMISGRMASTGKHMQQQRAEITTARDDKQRRLKSNKAKASRLGIATILVEDTEHDARALEQLQAGLVSDEETANPEENKP